jgi:hypothetical protein
MAIYNTSSSFQFDDYFSATPIRANPAARIVAKFIGRASEAKEFISSARTRQAIKYVMP